MTNISFFLVNSKPELPKSLVKTVKSNFGKGRGDIKSTYYSKLLEMRRLSNHKLAGLKLNSKQTRAVCWLMHLKRVVHFSPPILLVTHPRVSHLTPV